MLRWASENLLQLKPEEIGEHYGRYRLHVPEAERAMAKSLERYGQLAPVVVCRRHDRYELIDGFKRLGAARRLAQIDHLSARLMEADERTVKAAERPVEVLILNQRQSSQDYRHMVRT
jgi:ParB-like chromosome segregation protein Spo0J